MNDPEPFQAPSSPVSTPNQPSSNASGEAGILETLDRLGSLKDKGYITEEEFSAKKADLLGRL
jgi:hypothetical protein